MNLTPREQQVIGVMLLWPGLQDQAYAGLLGLTLNTIKKYIINIRCKLGVRQYSRNALFIELFALANRMRAAGTPELRPTLYAIQEHRRTQLQPGYRRAAAAKRRERVRAARKTLSVQLELL